MNSNKQGFFVTEDGRNVLFTFILVSSLFLLWGVCNGMIDVMDKHFQDELHLSKAQSAWVQFAHYLGYFLMSLPAGWLATRLGYKGGIIAGLLMVAVGGVLFYPGKAFGGLRNRFRLNLSGDGSQSLHNGAGLPALCGRAHQSGPVLQRRGLDLRPDPGQLVFLFKRCRWQKHGEPDSLHSLCRCGGGRHPSRADVLFCERAGHQSGG